MLEDTTFIIPLRIDSEDRIRNIKLTSKFLLDHFDSKIIIKECAGEQRLDISDIQDPRLTYLYEYSPNEMFHKTKLLNDMIVMSDTEVVVQYDSDIILPISTYIQADLMVRSGYDSVFPFIHGHYSSKKINLDKDSEIRFRETYDFGILDACADQWGPQNNNGYAHFGFCTFYNKNSYINGFLENEEFYSGGPEDQEIHHRFVKLGLNVGRVNDVVYHIEHHRGNFSAENNEHYYNNIDLYNRLMEMGREELIEYYSTRPYYIQRLKEISE